MSTVVLGERPAELEALLARRRALGLDGHDEVWEGAHHVAPHAHSDHGIVQAELGAALGPGAKARGFRPSGAFNLGTTEDYRVPDLGFHEGRPGSMYVATVAVVVEVLSPMTRPGRSSASTPTGGCASCWWPIPRSARCAAGGWSKVRMRRPTRAGSWLLARIS